MAENDSGERTEQPTPKRLDDARKKGQVPRSRELNTMVIMALSAVAMAVGACAAQGMPGPALPSALEAGWDRKPVCELQHETRTHPVLHCVFVPGVGHERHFHPAHYGYALSGGKMRMTDSRGVREVEIATGSSFSSDGVGWHEVFNIGDTAVAYLIIEER